MQSNRSDLAAALVSLLVPSFFAFSYFVLANDPAPARTLFVLARGFLIGFPLFWTIVIDRKGFPAPRMKSDGMHAGFWVGMAITLAGVGLYFTVFEDLLRVEGVQQKAALLGFGGSLYWIYSLLIMVGNSSLEEYYWRWFCLGKLRVVTSLTAALIVSALGFTLHHVIVLAVYFGWLYAALFGLCVFIGGVIFAYLYIKYDCIWSPWVCHAVIDAGIMVVGYRMIFGIEG